MRSITRLETLGAALLLVAAGCTTSTDPTTTTSSPATPTSVGVTTTTEDPALRQALPVDPLVTKGELDNGLAYYIRENDSPGRRAELRLLVDAGSVQEDPDQAGMAHFLEHMMFNGTERFPRNELIGVLESFGPRFGPDINAYTSFDETVYELSLTTDDEELVELGIDVLREWATRATLTDVDVVEERGVILDEWRLRAQGFGARVTEQLQDLVLPGSVYEGHEPIGTDESIVGTSSAELQRFYSDWYHPDRMAIVAVGDFDGSVIQELIEETFSDIPADLDPRAWDDFPFDPPDRARVRSYVDEEATTAGVTVLWSTPAPALMTVADYQASLAASFGLGILGDRLSDDATIDGGPLLGAGVLDFSWTRTVAVRGVDADVRAANSKDGLRKVLTEVERMRRHGVTTDEFERAVSGYSVLSRQLFDQQDSIQDGQLADRIVAHHLSGGHLMSPEQRFGVESGILARLTRQDVDAAMSRLFDLPPAVLVLGPDDSGLEIPTEGEILEVVNEMPSISIDPREQVAEGAVRLMATPNPAPVDASTVDPRFGFTTLQFANGATVYLWESDIAQRSVFASVVGFGGTSVLDVEDLPEAFLMTEIVGRSGVAEFNEPDLRRILSDRIVGVQPWVGETRQGLEGSSSTEDVEWLFQLINLTITEPRFDPVVVDALLDEMATLNASRADIPDVLFSEALNDAYYGDDPRYFVLPSPEQLGSFDVVAAERIFRERFANAGKLAFAFVGDFEVPAMSDLAARYIGTLPGDPDPRGYVDNQPLPPRRVQIATVEAGSGNQGQVGLFFTNEHVAEPKDRLAARLVELILTARLRERIREELSATYSITARIDLQSDPDDYAEAFVSSTGDPAGLDQIADEVVREIASLQTLGPSGAQFETAIAQLTDEYELIDNRTLAEALITSYLYPDRTVDELADRLPLVTEMTPGDVQRMAQVAFDLDQRIEIRQIPRS